MEIFDDSSEDDNIDANECLFSLTLLLVEIFIYNMY